VCSVFLKNNQIASSVMFGVAAEAVFYQLFEWMKKNATNPTFKSRIERAEKQVNSLTKLNNIRDCWILP
jgi:hypothetical protein